MKCILKMRSLLNVLSVCLILISGIANATDYMVLCSNVPEVELLWGETGTEISSTWGAYHAFNINKDLDPDYVLETPSKYGYEFLGWYTLPNNTSGNVNVIDDATSLVGKSGVTFSSSFKYTTISPNNYYIVYAFFKEKMYEITFNENYSGGDISTSDIQEGKTYGTLPTPTRTGYTLNGWYTATSGGTKIKSSDIVTEDKTLYAQWTPVTYTVSFNSNGGSSVSSQNVTFGSTYGVLPTPVRTGYTFDGWYYSGNKITQSTTCYTAGDHELIAQWTANTYTVKFNANGGSVSTSSKTVTYDSEYGILPTPTRTGHTFEGWWTSVSGGSQITSSTAVTITANQTLYARWTAEQYTVYFIYNGGSASTAQRTVIYGTTYGTLPTSTRTGYTFDGWYTSQVGGDKVSSSTEVTATSDHYLYAHWTVNNYTITFDANGGTGGKTVSLAYGSTLTAPSVSRTGYTFNGWNPSVPSTVPAANSTYKALWTANTYTVWLDANGGSVSSSSIPVTYDSTYGTLPTPTRNGYTFNGWWTSATGGSRVYSTTTVKTAQNHYIYAQWIANTYTVTFDPNGGTVSPTSKTVTYGSEYGSLPTPEREGFSFTGWITEGGISINDNTTVSIYSDHTLYAGWSENVSYINIVFCNGSGGVYYTYTAEINDEFTLEIPSEYKPSSSIVTGSSSGIKHVGWSVNIGGGISFVDYIMYQSIVDSGTIGDKTVYLFPVIEEVE